MKEGILEVVDHLLIKTRKRYLILLLIILLGFAIRVYLLNDLTMTGDDRNVVNGFLDIPFRDVFTITTKHGFPEHTFANILIWSANKLGWQLFILRWPGVWFGVLTLAITYRIVQKILNEWYGLGATLLLAISQRHVYFSHQIRGYSEMIFLAMASFYFLWQGMETRRWRNWFLFALTSALGIYNHIFSATLLATQGLIVAVWLVLRAWQQRPKFTPFFRDQVIPPLMGGVGGVVMSVVLYLPLLPQFLRNFVAADSDFSTSTTSFSETVLPYLNLFKDYSGAVPSWSLFLFLTLSLAGTVLLLRIEPKLTGFLLGWLVIPLLIVFFGQFYIGWFYARDRYLSYTLPAFIILAAIGWIGLVRLAWRNTPAIGTTSLGLSLGGVLITAGISISSYFETTAYGNWHNVSNYLVDNAVHTDMILCEQFGHSWKPVDLSLTDECTYSLTYQIEEQAALLYPIINFPLAATYDTFKEYPVLLRRNPRVWVVMWNIPESVKYDNSLPEVTFNKFGQTVVIGPIARENTIASLIEALQQINTLSEKPSTKFALLTRLADLQAALGNREAAAKTLTQAKNIMPADDRAGSQVAIVEQHLSQPSLVMTPDHTLSVELGNQIGLTGYSLTPESVVRGQPIRVTLFWQALVSIQKNHSIFLHLRNEFNQTVAQLDFSPMIPTSSWWTRDRLQDTVNLEVPPDLPSGRYRLLVGVYNADTQQRLPVKNDLSGENAVELTILEIQ